MNEDEFYSAHEKEAASFKQAEILFGWLTNAYSAIWAGDIEGWEIALTKLRGLPKDDLFTKRIRDAHEAICDMGWSNELSQVTSEIHAALDPLPIKPKAGA